MMVGALYFMNEKSWHKSGPGMGVSNDDELKEYVRCAIVNMYMEILRASSCGADWGLYYAWYTMKEMEDGIGPGLITNGKCGQRMFQNIQTKEFDMAEKIKKWLKKNKGVTEKIGGNKIKSICTQSLAELGAGKASKHDKDEKIKLQPQEKRLIQTLSQELKTIVEEVQKEVVQCARENGACMEPIQDVSSTDIDDDVNEAIVSNSVNSDTPAPSGKVGGKESSTPATSGPVGVPDGAAVDPVSALSVLPVPDAALLSVGDDGDSGGDTGACGGGGLAGGTSSPDAEESALPGPGGCADLAAPIPGVLSRSAALTPAAGSGVFSLGDDSRIKQEEQQEK
ncbi:hypothetical protein AK88_05640 [Plasmodium fragile]|uniref:Schizont-infected cell agglutination extracellular alpha domain-containing protein n=1 Tax=Plasmodium fragile TaxID=5857 RepID=A0A0D9QD29_PLAFR|nr:uncharacterized protein AK88_05640 [Plasmodium fragile]KJP84727.1 hypothetical protein AK88_05640 [Plasmodium fragile]